MKFPGILLHMRKPLLFVLILYSFFRVNSQEVMLPSDLRQYNLTQYNSSLFNPAFSLDRNHPQSLSLWVRWQWQQVDADPTTVFANYTHRMNSNSALSVGFLQQNTGLFLQSGGVLNYAYAFDLGPDISLALGLNVFGFRQELADDRFLQNPGAGLPQLNNEPSFVLQTAPGIQFGYGNFNLGLAVENALLYHTTDGGQDNSEGKIFLGSTSYRIPVEGKGFLAGGMIRPMVYVKTIPELDTQFGMNTLFSTDRFWIQGGYHNFYGISGGLGGTFFEKFSLGALIEIGTSADLEAKEPSFEIVTSYHFGAPDLRRKIVGFDVEEDDRPEEVSELKKKLNRKERMALEEADAQRINDSLLRETNRRDSILQVQKKAEEEARAREALEMQRRKDSMEAAAKIEAEKLEQETVIPQEGERFEEAVISEDVKPGFYLIVNAFGTKRYLDLFVRTLSEKGLNPRYFYRTERRLNYVYLERYDTMQEARKARDSKFFGKYSDTIWIFRVRGQ